MLKNKCKILILSVIIFSFISTFCFATIEPRTTDESDIMPISEDYDDEIDTTAVEEDSVSLDWINEDYYFSGDKITLSQIIDGNAFVIADEVTVTGEIGGDLFVCANKLNIEGGYIYSSLFAVANEIIINGTIYDIYAVTDNFTLDNNGYVYRDLRVTANTLNINGSVRRNAFLSGTTYNFNSDNGTLIGGNLKYSCNNEIDIPDSVVTGEIQYNSKEVTEESVVSKVLSYVYNALNNLILTLVVILLSIWLAPKFTSRVTNMNTKKSCVCLGVGILTPIFAIISILLLLFSTICSTVAIASAFIFIAICMAGTAFASIYFGGLIAKKFKWNNKVKFVLSTLLTTLIIWAISHIPYIGNLIGFLVALFGIGILIVNIIDKKNDNVILETETTEE